MTAPAAPMDTWIVVPSFNEGAPLQGVIASLIAQAYSIVVVDDGSDRPVTVPADPSVHLVRHCLNLGQGAAIQTGIDYAIGLGAQYLVMFDADGQHRADEIESLVAPLKAGVADIALGTRFGRGGRALNIPPRRAAALRLATAITRVTTGLDVTDTHNGFRAMTRETGMRLRITQNRMAHASQILEEIGRLTLRYVEVPVTIEYTAYSIAKGQRLSNMFNILWESIFGRIA